MAWRPKATSNQADSDLDAEQTLSIDHARWSGFRDPLGERENGVDEQGFSIELLRLRKELNSCALPLTDRILRLIDFDRPGAARALRVDQDENSPRLILVSERAPGFRLSELLVQGAERGVIPDLGAALYIMRRLLATAVGIQRTAGITHLAIAPERIVITPRGGVVLVEAAIGAAIEALGDRMTAAVRHGFRLARADAEISGAHVDIARIALVGMAMIVGRPLDPSEDVDPLSPVVQEVVDVAAVRAGDQCAAALTAWLDHAISVDPLLAFGSYEDALADLAETVPPADARCPVSRAPLRKFLDDLQIDGTQLEALEEDRVREIRARHLRREPSVEFEAPVETILAADDPIAAIMDMPVAVQDLSSEILRQPVFVDDQPSAMAAVIRHAAPAPDDDAITIDFVDDEPAVEEPAEEDEAPIELQPLEPGVVLDNVEHGSAYDSAPEPLSDALIAEPASDFSDAEPITVDIDLADLEPLTEDAEPVASAERSLDDLVDEILRRGVDSDLPELSTADEVLEELPHLPEHYGLGETPHYEFEETLAEPPVDEPPAHEPPVDEPGTEEPPAEEPPPYEAPVEDPPVEGPPSDETPPIWLRAAVEQVARTREERPATPAPRRSEPLGPVFELSDEPEPELQPETSTLSDIAKELGLTIPVIDTSKAGARAVAPEETETAQPEESAEASAWPEESAEENAAWDADIRKTLFAAPPPPEPPPAFTPPPAAYAPPRPPPVEEPEVFTPLPSPVALEPPVYSAPLPVAEVEPPAPAVDTVPRRSLADRTADIRESGGRFVKIAATLVLVVGGLGAAAYGGWRYYSSLSTPGTLVVESTPSGAQVEIDGMQRGTTPLTLDLPPGTHALALTRRGITRRFDVAVRPGEQTSQGLDWTQVRETGSLAVTTDPPGAKVSVDGKAVGVSPLTIPDLPAGRRKVVLEGQGGTVRREVTIETDRTATLSEAIFSGFLAVFAPVELQIYEGNRLLGTTENNRIMIPAGRHELTLVNRELGSRLTRSVDVEPGQVAAINITEVPAAAPAAQPAAEPPAPAAADPPQL
jgi:hypothetical protein